MRRLDISKRARTLVATAALATAIGLGVVPIPGMPAAEANAGTLPDLTVSIALDHANKVYRPGEAVLFEFQLRNIGWSGTFPYVNMLIPSAFTGVKAGQYNVDACTVKPPTASIEGHYINCQAPEGVVDGAFVGLLGKKSPRSIYVLGNAPMQEGRYVIKAGIGGKNEQATQNNNAAEYLTVAAPPNRFRPGPNACVSGNC